MPDAAAERQHAPRAADPSGTASHRHERLRLWRSFPGLVLSLRISALRLQTGRPRLRMEYGRKSDSVRVAPPSSVNGLFRGRRCLPWNPALKYALAKNTRERERLSPP